MDTPDFDALVRLGISGEAIEAYASLVVNDVAVAGAVADELEAAGLVERVRGELSPRPLAPVVARWAAERAFEDRTVRAAAGLLDGFFEQHASRHAATFLTYLRGERAVSDAANDAISSARVSVDEFIRGPFNRPDELEMMESQPEALQQGVRYRVLYDAELLASEKLRMLIHQSIVMGEESRSHPSLPMRMMIVDGSTAIIILPSAVTEESLAMDGLLVRSSPLIDILVRLFEHYWESGVQLESQDADGEVDDTRLLQLLAQGLTDHAVSAMLGISTRTLQRRVAAISTRLGAIGRMQLGVEAHRRGLLD